MRFMKPPIWFFLQAEDGIRATSVTGVQTCALPISDAPARRRGRPRRRAGASAPSESAEAADRWRAGRHGPGRSEERRVGRAGGGGGGRTDDEGDLRSRRSEVQRARQVGDEERSADS